ncbi:hypothetical protein B0J11DRAFT_585692 [Dendryphion nanum]|uniref:Uncharacterized protein n=1 Tax=Dendryphion nanum TaxID=256645 RepID=A0A9P9I9R8_9PLEO|nr:hypothetical protein B0J11DRAFT_585692 [Dendryphion nanum]
MSRKSYPRKTYQDKMHPEPKKSKHHEDAEIFKLLKTCLPDSVRSKCSLCGQARSSKRQNDGSEDSIDILICSRPKCKQFKALLANISTPKTLTVEINHYHYNSAGVEVTEPCNTAELHGASSLVNRVELSGEAVYRPYSGAHATNVRPLLTRPEIAPPPVNMPRKSTYGIENTRKHAGSF